MNDEQPTPPNIPMPRGKPQERRRWGLVVMIPLAVLMIVIFVMALEWKESLKIQRVFVSGASTLTAKDVYAMANVPVQSAMFGISIADVQKRILKNPYVRAARVVRRFPNVLDIDIEEREPVASVNAGQLCYVDTAGVLLPGVTSARKFDLPLIIGIDGVQSAQIGKPIENEDIFEAIAVIEAARMTDTAVYQLISEVDMNSGGDIRLYSADAGVPIMIGRGDIPRKLSLLQTFWAQFVASGDAGKLQSVDLRYEDQVVVRWQHGESTMRKTAL
jgi:cell division septal protein FtsQ